MAPAGVQRRHGAASRNSARPSGEAKLQDLYRKLGSDHLVEPTLRHLAWWLLTREDSGPAATERELIAKTTEFLREREYETVDEAQQAAREFID